MFCAVKQSFQVMGYKADLHNKEAWRQEAQEQCQRAPLTETRVLAPTPARAVPEELWSWGLCIIRAIFSLNPISNSFWLKASLLVSIYVYGESECSNWSETRGHTTTGANEGAPASAGVSRQTSQQEIEMSPRSWACMCDSL